ncbi:hypothetical protein QY97_02354 [Bacillus thermotolerans]|uniref:Uncharacterized protein n=1 Tax=Bacillus thermotolerans TaxID=1221996 RepID=A0A0F5HZH1_BACTR|nr:hypothetical protein QY96_03557 [Bacillus thermotolerans]KKB37630.1 hypothetical protein QY95_02740 [Bacillus thermotolerans]KKB38445.1 hypothetical protein QY97_02354 [Bacillus thermotolerans]
MGLQEGPFWSLFLFEARTDNAQAGRMLSLFWQLCYYLMSAFLFYDLIERIGEYD